MIPIWKEIRARARAFAWDWREASRERSEAQSFYNDFFEIFGIRRRSVAHYEELVEKRLGKRGFTDLFWPDVLLVEQKSAGRSLDEAYDQAGDYFDGMKEEDRPRFILVSDFQTFELRDLEEQRRVPFRLQELPEHVEEFEFILEAAHGKETWKAPEFVLPRQWEERYPTNLGSVDAVRPQLEAASEIVLKWPKSLPDGEEIDRPELAELESRIEGSTGSTTAVLGKPGSGKSALVSTLAHRYIERGWPVLAIKGDMLDADISTEAELREHLGLDARPSDLLEQLAESGPVLLVLDQVDALAGYIDLRTARLNVLLNLVRRLGRVDNVHIVISARTFEFEHDSRLKSVAAESVSLELPPWTESPEGAGISWRPRRRVAPRRTGGDALTASAGYLPDTQRAPRLRGICELPNHARPAVERASAWNTMRVAVEVCSQPRSPIAWPMRKACGSQRRDLTRTSRTSMHSSPRGSSPEWTGGWDSRTRRGLTMHSPETSARGTGTPERLRARAPGLAISAAKALGGPNLSARGRTERLPSGGSRQSGTHRVYGVTCGICSSNSSVSKRNRPSAKQC